jgi:serine/threonine protein kinase
MLVGVTPYFSTNKD